MVKQRILIVKSHTVIFMLVILFNIFGIVVFPIKALISGSQASGRANCIALETALGIKFFSYILCIVFYILITFMSIKFSQPMKIQWQKFIEKAKRIDSSQNNSIEIRDHGSFQRNSITNEDFKILDILNEEEVTKSDKTVILSHESYLLKSSI